MTKNIGIIDYDVGNLLNVYNACEYLGAKARLITHAEQIADTDYLILPGVGSCRAGMQGLTERHFVEAIQDYCKTGKGLLGICLGMQLLANGSEEGGYTSALGLIPGEVKAIPSITNSGAAVFIPNINWLNASVTDSGQRFTQYLQNKYFYYVHSYRFETPSLEYVAATTDYQGIEINAIVCNDNIIGCQFHPEKSSAAGLALLRFFINEF